MAEGTSDEKEQPKRHTPKICPLRKQKLIGEQLFGLNEVDAPCVHEGCALWDEEWRRCSIVTAAKSLDGIAGIMGVR
jgi:hypothetical protein